MKSANPAATATHDAALWVLRHDRGLTAAEQDEFSQWLAADPKNRAAFAEQRWGWDELDRLAGLQSSIQAVADPDLLAPPRRRRLTPVYRLMLPAVAAAAVVVSFLIFTSRTTVNAPASWDASPQLALIEQRLLPDGSVIELNRGAIIAEAFDDRVRRVRLLQGEAHFQVIHDSERPFVVEAAGVAVRAVGTAFNVRLETTSVEVIVTEGRVRVNDVVHGESLLAEEPAGQSPLLSAGQSARVELAPTLIPQVKEVPPEELARRLAWKPHLLDFTNAPMPEIVAAFNRGNPVRLSLGDALLADMRLSATFRSDNVEGFVRLMESDFDLRVEWRGDQEIILRRVRP